MAKLPERILGHRSIGHSPWETHRTERRLAGIVILYLVLIAGIVGYNAREMSRERGAALSLNVAARQRALAERYVRDAFLEVEGIQADPIDDATQLLTNADALLARWRRDRGAGGRQRGAHPARERRPSRHREVAS